MPEKPSLQRLDGFVNNILGYEKVEAKLMIDLPKYQNRLMAIQPETVTVSEDVFEFSFASGFAVDRGQYREVLDLNGVDLSRVYNGAVPWLFNHRESEVLGQVLAVWQRGDRLYCRTRLGDSDCARKYAADIRSGVLPNVSCRYTCDDHTERLGSDGVPVVTISSWMLLEVSSCPIAADPTVGVGRAKSLDENIGVRKTMPTAARMSKQREAEERDRIRNIEAMPTKWGNKIPGGVARAMQLAQQAIDEDLTEEEARSLITSEIRGNDSYSISRPSPQFDMGLSAKERDQYSLFNLIRSQVEPGYQGGSFELDLHQEIVQRGIKPQHGGVFVPVNELSWNSRQQQQRAFLAQGAGTASPLVPEQYLAGNFVEALRSTAYCLMLGTTVLEGLQGDVIIPRRASIGAAGWVAENTDLPLAEGTFDQISMLPKTIGAYATFSRLAMVQTNPMIESLIKADFIDAIARGIDLAIIAGTGASNQPRGILSTAGIGTVSLGTNGGAITYGAMLDLEASLSTANALTGSIGYLSTPQVTRRAKETLEFATAGAKAVWQPDPQGRAGMGVVNGYKAAMSTNVPSNLTKGSGTGLSAIIMANWQDIILGQWGILEIVTNPYGAGFRKGEIEVRAMLFADINVRNAKSIAVITDALTT